MTNKTARTNRTYKKYLIGLISLIGLIVLGVTLYNVSYNNSIRSSLKDSRTLKTEEAIKEATVSAINQLYELPTDSDVTIGTITNIEELKNKQKYFEKAKNGDLLLIYPDKTIIYDPVNKTVVDVANVKLMK